MKSFIVSLAILAIGISAHADDIKSTNITIYNSNLGVVRQSRQADFKKGVFELLVTDVPTAIKTATVKASLNGSIIEQNYRYDLASMQKILAKYIGQIITARKGEESVTGELMASGNSLVIKKSDNSLVMLPSISEYQVTVEKMPEGLITVPTLVWKVNSAVSGKSDYEISYQTGGMTWSAEYVGVLNDDETKMSLSGWVNLTNNSGATFKDAKLKVVAGDVNRNIGSEYGGFNLELNMQSKRADMAAYEPQFEERSLFDYHIYEMKGLTTLMDNEQKQISLFNAEDISVKKEYKVSLHNNPTENVNAGSYISFMNNEKNNLGMPIPRGAVRMNKMDKNSLEFIGENYVNHTPRNEEVELLLGDAFDVLADQKEIEYKRVSDNVTERTYEMIVRNRKDSPIELSVMRLIGRDTEVLESSMKYEKDGVERIKYSVSLKADEEKSIKLKLRFIRRR